MITSRKGLRGSLTQACNGYVVTGRRKPAMAAMVEHQPAVAFRTVPVLMKPREVWTQLEKERSPLHYFQGALIPTRKTKDDVYFKYVGLKRRNLKHTPYWNDV